MIKAERTVENQQGLPSQLNTLLADIEEKRTRLNKIKTEIGVAKYDSRIAEKSERAKILEEKREALNAEIATLGLQADARAKLDLKRDEVKTKKGEIISK